MPGIRVTNLEIQKWVVRTHGFVPESGWIEHCKELAGVGQSSEPAVNPCPNPCPVEKQALLMQALRRLGAV
jgi:hypothetical protein